MYGLIVANDGLQEFKSEGLQTVFKVHNAVIAHIPLMPFDIFMMIIFDTMMSYTIDRHRKIEIKEPINGFCNSIIYAK